MRYHPHEDLIRPAKDSAHPATLLFGCVLLIVIHSSLAWFYINTVVSAFGHAEAIQLFDETRPTGVIMALLGFFIMILSLTLVLRLLHRRNLTELFGPRSQAKADFITCSKALVPLFALMFLLPWPEPMTLSRNLALITWLMWLPLALPLLFVQISAEELVFRGYLQSQLAARFRHPLIWIALPSILFGALHYSPALAGDNAWMLVVWATVFGAAAADLTARTGNLGPALALHFINNLFAVLIHAPQDSMGGLALYTFPLDLTQDGIAQMILPYEILFTFCAWLAARLALRV